MILSRWYLMHLICIFRFAHVSLNWSPSMESIPFQCKQLVSVVRTWSVGFCAWPQQSDWPRPAADHMLGSKQHSHRHLECLRIVCATQSHDKINQNHIQSTIDEFETPTCQDQKNILGIAQSVIHALQTEPDLPDLVWLLLQECRSILAHFSHWK